MYIFKEHLRSIRKAKKATQKEVSIAVGVTERNYQDWEYGNTKPGFDALIALADYFDVSLDYLVGRSDDPARRWFDVYDFSVRFKELRLEKKLTQKQLAEAIGASERGIQNYEIGARKPEYDAIIKLCQFFEVSADYLLGLSDDPTRRWFGMQLVLYWNKLGVL